jgi:hypothetical protein
LVYRPAVLFGMNVQRQGFLSRESSSTSSLRRLLARRQARSDPQTPHGGAPSWGGLGQTTASSVRGRYPAWRLAF